MGINEAYGQQERMPTRFTFSEKGEGLFRNPDNISRLTFLPDMPGISLSWTNMHFTQDAGAVSQMIEE
jgi:hypothetical protein